MELELPAGGIVNRDAEHIRGQQVRGELHALEAQPEAGGHRMGQRGLAQARQIFNQQVTARQQGDERQPHFMCLAQHQPVDLVLGAAEGLSHYIG